MAIELPPLPYEPGALAPALSAEAVRYHHGHHHAGYVRTLNSLVRGGPLGSASLEEIIRQSSGPLANVAAQVWNHTFFWASLAPDGGSPSGELAEAINRDFGSMDGLAARFRKSALELFGSGWTWLVAGPSGGLELLNTPNAGLRLHEEQWKPLLVCDVWEHAYYIDYRGDRAAYLEAFWSVISWPAASLRLAAQETREAGQRKPPRRSAGRTAARSAPPASSSWHPRHRGAPAGG